MTAQTPTDQFGDLLAFLLRLDAWSVAYHPTSVRPDAIMVQLAIPGERWEVELMADGTIKDGSALTHLRERLAQDRL
jgi:hypothetical protein